MRDDTNEFKKVGQIKVFTFQNLEALYFEKECNCFVSTHSKQKKNSFFNNSIENIPGLNHTATLLSGFLELSNVNIGEEQVNYLELIRFYNLIYDTLTRLDPNFAGVYKTQVYDPKYVDSLNTDLK
ncbi:flagellar basal body rod C-terminal domain-containing protein [Leptospira kirschneri]|uniref:flagellar basal body rod C-terminal domain-containing protein n=1 Tax=Leptospira kirschneri TaxID=29507 RepID=UPI00277B5A25|nr:flagellar basal body rod C-terminal domain-containing protein [Leptospira kirschneri]